MASESYELSESLTIGAAPEDIFDVISQPRLHPQISGDSSVAGVRTGVERITRAGDRFGMKMHTAWPTRGDGSPWVRLPYSLTNTVIDYEANRRISWRHIGGHVWTWAIEPTDDGRSRVTETVDFNPSPVRWLYRLIGYPSAHEQNLRNSLENLRDLIAEDSES